MAIRAASIWRAVTQPHSSACRPKSPKEMVSPPLALPRMRFFCALRNLVLLGDIMAARTLLLIRPGGSRSRRTRARRQNLTLEDPALHADLAVGGVRLGKAVLDIGAESMQRHPTLAVPLVARHLGAAQAARRGHADALGAELHGRLHRLLHGATEGDAALELGRDVLGDQLRIRLGLTDLLDVQEDLVVGERLDFLLELLDAGATLADDDARTRRVDVDLRLVGGALDIDAGDAGMLKLLLDFLLQLDVFMQPLGVVLLFVPLGRPGLDDAQAEADRMRFLTHDYSSTTRTVTWLVRWLTRLARPIERGIHRLRIGPLSTLQSRIKS